NTHDSTEPERSTPAVVQDDCGDERWSESRPNANAAEDNTVCLASFNPWKPALDKLAGGRVHRCFTGAEQEADEDQYNDGPVHRWRNDGGEHGEDSPPKHSEGQYK